MEDQTYNGYKNFQTWKLALNISNEERICAGFWEALESQEVISGESLKKWLEENIDYSNDYNTWRIFDTWSNEEWNQIDFQEVYDNLREE